MRRPVDFFSKPASIAAFRARGTAGGAQARNTSKVQVAGGRIEPLDLARQPVDLRLALGESLGREKVRWRTSHA